MQYFCKVSTLFYLTHVVIAFMQLILDIKGNRLGILNQVALNAFTMRQGVPVFSDDRIMHVNLGTFVMKDRALRKFSTSYWSR